MKSITALENKTATIKQPTALRTIISERNLLNFPFNALSDKDVKRRTREGAETQIEYRQGGKLFKGTIAIRPNAHYGFPPPKDYKIRKAIEYLLTENGYPVSRYFGFTGYAVCEVLGQDPHNGRNHEEIRQCLARLKLTGIEAKGVLFDKATGKPFHTGRVFSILDDYGYRQEEDDQGAVAATHWIRLSDWYLTSLNAGYVRPSDLDYFLALGNDVAGRLYDLLAAKFFGLFMNRPESEWLTDSTYAKYEYKELCDILPIVDQTYFSDAKRNLSGAHERLIGNQRDFAQHFGWQAVGDGFIRKCVWKQTTEKQSKWHVHYYPGIRAIEEFKRFREEFKDRLSAAEQIEMALEPPESKNPDRLEAPQSSADPVDDIRGQGSAINSSDRENLASESTPDADQTSMNLAEQLIDRGIRPGAAAELAKTYPHRVGRKVEEYDWIKAHEPKRISKWVGDEAPGFLIGSIKENYDAPTAFVSKAELEDRARAKKQVAQELLREFDQQKAQIIADIDALLKLPLEQQVAPMLDAWDQTQRKVKNKAPSPEERAQRQALYIKNLSSRDQMYARRLKDLQATVESKAQEQGIEAPAFS